MVAEVSLAGVVFKQMILGASAFAVGVLLYRALFFERRRHRPYLALGLAGVATTLVLIAEIVVRAPLVSPSWRSVLYILGVSAIAVGFLGDAIRERHRRP